MKKIPPSDQDPKTKEIQNRIGNKTQHWIVDPKGIDFTKTVEEHIDKLKAWDRADQTGWDDNEQHTEQGI